MAFTYEGVNVDIAVPGYPTVSAAATRANNIITIATRRLAEIDGIVASYQAAYTPYAAAIAYGKTLDTRSRDTSVRNAIIANQAQIIKLHPELAKWGKIVIANGGKFASGTVGNTGSSLDAVPNFTAKRKKYNDDIDKYNRILLAAGPQICTGLPPATAVQSALMNNARAESDATAARVDATVNSRVALTSRLGELVNPNQSSNSPGFAGSRDPSVINGVLGQLQGSGGVPWDARTLLLAFDSAPNSRMFNRPTNAQIASLLRSGRIKNNTPLSQVQSALLSFGRKRIR